MVQGTGNGAIVQGGDGETLTRVPGRRATIYGGEIRMNTPFIFTIGFIILFTIGGLKDHLALNGKTTIS